MEADKTNINLESTAPRNRVRTFVLLMSGATLALGLLLFQKPVYAAGGDYCGPSACGYAGGCVGGGTTYPGGGSCCGEGGYWYSGSC